MGAEVSGKGTFLERYWGGVMILVIIVTTAPVAAVIAWKSELRFSFAVMALLAATMGMAGALLRMLAHDMENGRGLDMLGKAMGFYSALTAFLAAGLILWIQLEYPGVTL